MSAFNLCICISVDGAIRSIYFLEPSRLELIDLEANLPPIESINSLPLDRHALISNKELNYVIFRYRTDILNVKPFLAELEASEDYRRFILLNFESRVRKCRLKTFECKCCVVVDSDLFRSYKIDYTWDRMLWRDCHMAIERECAAAWLSTLGGAYSALGDYSNKFAHRALSTSMQQLKLAKVCNDENGMARGWLFLALALSQLGFKQYANIFLSRAWNHPSCDPRHRNMCLGVRAKLRCDSTMRKRLTQSEKSALVNKRASLWESLKNLTI